MSSEISARLDSIRSHAFKIFLQEKEAEEIKRKNEKSLLDSKQETANKQKLYKLYDATTDTIWLRYVYLSQSSFRSEVSDPAHADLVRISSIGLELRQGIFDLFDLMARMRLASGGSLQAAHASDFIEKNAGRIYGLIAMQEKIAELASEVKIKITGEMQMALGGAMPTRRPDDQAFTPLIEAPIVLLEERLKHFSSLDREQLFQLVPPLRDLRNSLAIMYSLRCEHAAVLLALADSLGESYFRIISKGGVLRDDFAPVLLSAWNAARANSWVELASAHGVDLTQTAQVGGSVKQVKKGVTPSLVSPSSVSHQHKPLSNPQQSVSPTPAAGGAEATSPRMSPMAMSPLQKNLGTFVPSSPGAFSPITDGAEEEEIVVTAAPKVTPIAPVASKPAGSIGGGGLGAALAQARSNAVAPVTSAPPVTRPAAQAFSADAPPPLLSQSSASQSAAAVAALLTDEWVEAHTGKDVFYYNRRTGVSSWVKPSLAHSSILASAASAASVPATAASPSAAMLSRLAAENEEEEVLFSPSSPTNVAPVTAAASLAKSCAMAGCGKPRMGGKPYCAQHLQR